MALYSSAIYDILNARFFRLRRSAGQQKCLKLTELIYRVDFFTSLYWFINLHVNIYLAIDSLSVKESKDCNPFFRHMNLAKLFYLMIKIFAYRFVWQVKSTILKKTAYELERTKI